MNPMYKKDGITYSSHLEEHIDSKIDKQLKKQRTYSNQRPNIKGHYGSSNNTPKRK